MFKLVVFVALIGIAAARPGGLYRPIAVPAVASSYAYSTSIHAPDYINHASVSSSGLVGHSVAHLSYPGVDLHNGHHLVSPLIAPASVVSYSAPILHHGHGW